MFHLKLIILAKQLRANEYPVQIILAVYVEIVRIIYVCPVNAFGRHLDDRRTNAGSPVLLAPEGVRSTQKTKKNQNVNKTVQN